jgi:hypothetical protein
MNNRIRKILFWLFLIALSIPLLEAKGLYHIIKTHYLNEFDGFDPEVSDTTLSLPEWFSGNFQVKKERSFNRNYGFRNFFIRLNFQLEWSLFKNIPNNKIILGKDNFLFYKPFVSAFSGADYAGADSIRVKLNELKYINDTLEKLNKKLILIFAPNTADIHSAFLPDSMQHSKGPTNYGTYVNLLNGMNINFIDFNSYFKTKEKSSRYPLFTPFSSHYSIYGACLVADSIIRYIEYYTGKELPKAIIDSISEALPRENDEDLRKYMNLIFPIKSKSLFSYPCITIKERATSFKPSVLVIGDSFFNMLMKYYNIFGFFSKQSSFWYYNKDIYNGGYEDSDKLTLTPKEIDIRNEIQKCDVVIIMTSAPSLQHLGWGFIDETYNKFKK